MVSIQTYAPNRSDVRELIELATPVAFVQVGIMAMGLVDTFMVGRVSPVDLAAVAVGNLYFFGVAVFGMGVLFAIDPVLSQAVGASDDVGVARGVQRGGVLAAGLAILAMLLLIPVAPVLTVFRQPAEVVPVAAGYAHGLIAGVFPFYAFVVLRQALQAMGRVLPIVLVVLAANVLNAALNWAFVFGNAGFPAMGAVGSSWATTGSRWFLMVALLALAWPLLRGALVPLRRDAFSPRPLEKLLRLGAPVGTQQLLEFGVFGAAGLLMGLMGAVALASHQVALQLASLTFMVPLGVSQATSIRVGHAIGRGDPDGARRATGAGIVIGVGFMAITAAVFLTIPELLARGFSTDPVVIATAAALFPVAGVFQVFDGLQVVAAGALRGVGDTRVPMLMNFIGFWGIGLPMSAWLAFGVEAGPTGVWWGLASGLGVVSILLTHRIRTRFGRALTRLVIDDDAAPNDK
ncbi:MAG: MATE family efflux transporter [Gemmatimonadetes bacterium]|nr:MATE family efflux transporter [Gemmatimonadota bacterium]